MKNRNSSKSTSSPYSNPVQTIDLINSETSDLIDSMLNTKGYTGYKSGLRRGYKGYIFVINRNYKVWKSFDSMETLFDYVDNLEPLSKENNVDSMETLSDYVDNLESFSTENSVGSPLSTITYF